MFDIFLSTICYKPQKIQEAASNTRMQIILTKVSSIYEDIRILTFLWNKKKTEMREEIK